MREFYAALPRPVIVGIEATGSMGWFLTLMEEIGVTCRVGQHASQQSVAMLDPDTGETAEVTLRHEDHNL